MGGGEDVLVFQAKIRAGTYSEQRVNPDTLEGAHRKKRALKEERLARVMEGREGRDEFGASSARHKKKTGGKSNREKDKKKNLPLAARLKKVCAVLIARCLSQCGVTVHANVEPYVP
jgi:hypothetical protein